MPNGSDSSPSATETETSETGIDVALVELGPVVAAIEERGTVRVIDPILVVADEPGRLEGRTTAVGAPLMQGELALEFSDAPDPADALRVDILELEREIAELEGDLAEVERLDVAIAEAVAGNRAIGDDISVLAPTDGVISEYFVSVFDVVGAGDALFTIGDPANRAVVVDLDASTAAADDVGAPIVGAPVSLVDPRSSLGEPIAASVTSIEVSSELDAEDGQGQNASRRVLIGLDASASLTVGDTVNVVFESVSAATSLRLAADAVRGSGETGYVIVEDAAGEWQRVDIRIGARTQRFVQIVESVPALEAGDRVVLP